MSDNHQILIIDDDHQLRQVLVRTLQHARYEVLEASDGESALSVLAEHRPSLVLSDVRLPGMDGHELFTTVKRTHPDIPFVLMTGYGDVKKAVDAIQAGVADYIIKPFAPTVLIEVVNRLCTTVEEQDLVIHDERSKKLADLCRRVARTDVTLMISGESGSGKEIYSKYIHENSERSNQPFSAINCAAIPESMLESILFGYEKGAFTGAYTARAGKFEQANNGTLMLDEISEMDIGLQAKLLRVIQEKEVERLGGCKPIPLNVRIIATTNRNLRDEVAEGRFREDLFYRLNVFPLHLPPLRERRGDIVPIAQKIIEHLHPGKGIQLSDCAKDTLESHDWRGNVRELENVVQRTLILKRGNTIFAYDVLFEEIHHHNTSQNTESQPQIDTQKNTSPLDSDLKTREKEIIIDAVTTHRSRKQAAETLGISPRTLRYKLAQFRRDGIDIPGHVEAMRAL